jgi:hypothetical protein
VIVPYRAIPVQIIGVKKPRQARQKMDKKNPAEAGSVLQQYSYAFQGDSSGYNCFMPCHADDSRTRRQNAMALDCSVKIACCVNSKRSHPVDFRIKKPPVPNSSGASSKPQFIARNIFCRSVIGSIGSEICVPLIEKYGIPSMAAE